MLSEDFCCLVHLFYVNLVEIVTNISSLTSYVGVRKQKIFVPHNSEHMHNVDYKGRYVEKNEYKCSIMTEVERGMRT